MPLNPITPRTTALLASDQAVFRTRKVQQELLEAQRQISTGLRVAKPSDDPARLSAILDLQRRERAREGELQHIETAAVVVNAADAALGEAHDILIEAHSLASSQIGVGSDEATREAEAHVVSAQLAALTELANQRYGDVAVFGGRGEREHINADAPGGAPGDLFVPFLGGVRYLGTRDNLAIDAGASTYLDMTSNGVDAFGSLSARIESTIDLNPGAADDVRIADLGGGDGDGVAPGTISVAVNGNTVQLDLAAADSLGDVATLVTDAIETLAPGSGSLLVTPSGFQLQAAAGNTITLGESGEGTTAAMLALPASSVGPAATFGGDLAVRLTPLTRLANLGGLPDLASGLLITQGGTSKVADFLDDQTIQDMQNTVDALNLGVRLEINRDGDGLNLVSEVSGPRLSVGENGGSTARDLGLSSYGPSTLLSDFGDGIGVETQPGEPDVRVTLHDGTTFAADLSQAATVGDVVDALNAAAAGVTGGGFSIGYAAVGTGLTFTDTTAGGGAFTIDNAGLSLAATHLGIAGDAAGGNLIQGKDHAAVRVNSAFTHLADLRDALQSNSTPGITLAGGKLEDDAERVVSARGVVAARASRLDDHSQRLEDLQLAETTMLSQIRDADLTQVLTRFSQLNTQLQATLQTSAQSLQLSLLDYLR